MEGELFFFQNHGKDLNTVSILCDFGSMSRFLLCVHEFVTLVVEKLLYWAIRPSKKRCISLTTFL